MKPTDEQLNQAAAEACELTLHQNALGVWCVTISSFPGSADMPDYCTDRNALPELWEQVEQSGRMYEFGEALHHAVMTQREETPREASVWLYATAQSRLHVIAALKALSKWPGEWDV